MHAIVHETYADELVWLAGQVIADHAAMAEPRWNEIGVLTRDNSHAADVFDALTAREIPVEIVGLKGLMRLPEVSEVVSTLSLLQDLTANADVLNLLNGPRWAIGPRDLALLGRAGARSWPGLPLREAGITVAEELQRAVEGADPTEVVSLSDALADPGDLPYSEEARDPLRAARRGAPHPPDRRRGAAPRPGPPHHRHHRHRHRARLVGVARPPRPAATTSTCSSRRSRTSRPSTAR